MFTDTALAYAYLALITMFNEDLVQKIERFLCAIIFAHMILIVVVEVAFLIARLIEYFKNK